MQASAEVGPVGGVGRWLALFVGTIPRAFLPWAGAFLGWVAGSVFRIRRSHVERAMKEAGIGQTGAQELASLMYRSLGESLVEALWLAAHPTFLASRMFTMDEWSRARLQEVGEAGRGVVLATAHTGNWELAAAALAEVRDFTAVVKPMSMGWVERFCQESRGVRGIAVARPGDVMARAGAALRRGGTVAMMIDQVPDRARHACTTDFLSRPVDVDRSPALLAARMRVPFVVAVGRRAEGGRQQLEVLAVFHPPRVGRRLWAETSTRLATGLLERWVHAHPSEWLWMHRRWRRCA